MQSPEVPLAITYLFCPGELEPRTQAETVRCCDCRSAELGMRTKSLPSKRSAEPQKTPGIHAGSLSSAPAIEPSVPLFALPDQSWTVWPLPSFMGHQPDRGLPEADAAAGATRAHAVRTAANGAPKRRNLTMANDPSTPVRTRAPRTARLRAALDER